MIMALVAVIVLVFEMPISVTVAVIMVLMVLMVPVAFVKLPTLWIPVIVGVNPMCSGIRRPIVVSHNPSIVVALGHPETRDPDQRWRRRRRGRLIAYGWWWRTDKYGNLCRGGHR
jgi:hypothetical protein